MENIVIAEFDRLRTLLQTEFRGKYNLSDEDTEQIIQKLKTSLDKMVHLVKEGKTAHEKFYSDVILNSIDAIIGFSNQFKIFLWNKGAERIFGYTKDEVMNKDFAFLIPDYLIEKGEKEYIVDEVTNKGFLENYETERITKNNDILNVSISRFAIYDQNEMIGSVGIIRDITRLKALEKELREKERLALIGEVVSNIAHSLSNPLNIISGNADYLMLNKKSTDKDYEELKTILEEVTRITKSIRHLLNFSRPIRIHKDRHDLNKLIDRVLSHFKHIGGIKKIKFEKSFQKDLPELKFDESAIEEVINNLITNAIQATSSEGRIKIKTLLNHSIVKIEVSDSGAGISKENFTNIFLPFFSSKEYGKGTGLGLSIAKRIVQEHDGDIKVKSTVGKGTTFSISLPLILEKYESKNYKSNGLVYKSNSYQ